MVSSGLSCRMRWKKKLAEAPLVEGSTTVIPTLTTGELTSYGSSQSTPNRWEYAPKA